MIAHDPKGINLAYVPKYNYPPTPPLDTPDGPSGDSKLCSVYEEAPVFIDFNIFFS